MDSAQTRIADQSFVTRRAKDSVAAGHIQPQVHDSPGAFDGTVLGGKNFGRPMGAVTYSIGPSPRRSLSRCGPMDSSSMTISAMACCTSG